MNEQQKGELASIISVPAETSPEDFDFAREQIKKRLSGERDSIQPDLDTANDSDGGVVLPNHVRDQILLFVEFALNPVMWVGAGGLRSCASPTPEAVDEAYFHELWRCARVRLKDGRSYIDLASLPALRSELAEYDIGSRWEVEVIEMTQAEYDAMKEFEGH